MQARDKKKLKPRQQDITRSKTEKSTSISAEQFVEKLSLLCSEVELKKYERYFKMREGQYGEGDVFMGVRMGQVFALAKAFIEMEPGEIEKLLESHVHEVRAGAVSIMDFQARSKKTTERRKKELFDLYMKRHDRINNWDLVDRSAPYVVGGYLFDKPRNILYKLARSKNLWERRTAIASTYFFIRHGQVEDTFKIAEILLDDTHDLIHKATGSWLRAAGGKAPEQLLGFLHKYAAVMPRTTLRYAVERLDKKKRDHFMSAKIEG
jgi:3-methyladenine DNA glycosylase AlkD